MQGSLQPGEALFSFHLDEPVSLLWAVTRSRFRMLPLPPARSTPWRRVRAGCRNSAPKPNRSRERYSDAFRLLPADILRQSRWVLVLDGNLFELPVAALVSGRQGGRPEYLVERHPRNCRLPLCSGTARERAGTGSSSAWGIPSTMPPTRAGPPTALGLGEVSRPGCALGNGQARGKRA